MGSLLSNWVFHVRATLDEMWKCMEHSDLFTRHHAYEFHELNQSSKRILWVSLSSSLCCKIKYFIWIVFPLTLINGIIFSLIYIFFYCVIFYCTLSLKCNEKKTHNKDEVFWSSIDLMDWSLWAQLNRV